MFKKLLFTSLILSFLLLSNCSADALADLAQADSLAANGDYQQAETAYRTILTNYPGTDEALGAHKGLTIVYIALDRWSDAQTSYQQLTTDFSTNDQLPRAVWDIAEHCWDSGKYDKALVFYADVAVNWPTHEKALVSWKDVVQCNIIVGDYIVAQRAYEYMLSQFGQSDDVIDAMLCIARKYQKIGQDQKSNQCYQYIIDTWSDLQNPVISQVICLGIANASLGNDTATRANLEILGTTFVNHSDSVSAARKIVQQYWDAGNYTKVAEESQYIADIWPNDELAVYAQREVVCGYLRGGNHTAGQAAIDKLIADYSGNQGISQCYYAIAREYFGEYGSGKADAALVSLSAEEKETDYGILLQVADAAYDFKYPSDMNNTISNLDNMVVRLTGELAGKWYCYTAVSHIAEQYYHRAVKWGMLPNDNRTSEYYLQKAIDAWQLIEGVDGYYVDKAMVCCWMGDSYRKLGNYSKSIEKYQKVVDNYPQYDLAWDALCQVGRNYEKMVKAKLLSKTQANPEIRAAYEQLITQYPNCKAVKVANRWLTRNPVN